MDHPAVSRYFNNLNVRCQYDVVHRVSGIKHNSSIVRDQGNYVIDPALSHVRLV